MSSGSLPPPLDLSKVGREGVPDDVSSYHWGPMSRELCERELAEHPPGTFLLRQRLENLKDHVLSTITSNGFYHLIIKQQPGGKWQTTSRVFDSLSALVRDYQAKGLKDPLLRDMASGKQVPQHVFRWDQSRWAQIELSTSTQSHSVENLSFITFNVWFDAFKKRERANAIFDIAKSKNPDFICFQEVTTHFLQWLLEDEWFRSTYYITDITGNSWATWYGVIILSKYLPLRLGLVSDFPSVQGRRFLYVDVNLNGSLVRVGTVHLESHQKSTKYRLAQLDRIFPILTSSLVSHSLLLGDMNLCASWPENAPAFSDRNPEQYHLDLWPALHPHHRGYTEDTDINTMRLAYGTEGHEKKVRFDRILLRSSNDLWRPQTIELLGTLPIEKDVFPSDHFGLFAVLAFQLLWDHPPAALLRSSSIRSMLQPNMPQPSDIHEYEEPVDCYMDDLSVGNHDISGYSRTVPPSAFLSNV